MPNINPETVVPDVPQELIDRSNVWAIETLIDDRREQISPLLGKAFVRLWNMARLQREPIINHIQATGVKSAYQEFVTLNDENKLNAYDLLNFDLYTRELEIPSNLPAKTTRRYVLRLGVGGRVGADLNPYVSAGGKIPYLDSDWLKSMRESEAIRVAKTLASPHFQPNDIRLKEVVETALPLSDGKNDYYTEQDYTNSLSSEYGIHPVDWTPNLQFFGINQDLPPETTVYFHHQTPEGESCGIGSFGEFKGDKLTIAKALIRLEQLTDFLELHTGARKADSSDGHTPLPELIEADA